MFQLPLYLYHATPVASFLAVRCKMIHVICFSPDDVFTS